MAVDQQQLIGPAQPVADASSRADDPAYDFPPSGLSDEDAFKLMLQCLGRAEKRHMERVLNYLTNYKAYKGVLRGSADRWRSRLAPPYAYQILETLYCNLAEEDPRVRCVPQNRGSIHGAKCMEKARNYQRRKDYWAEKLPFWTKQGLIMGLSPMKVAWDQRVVKARSRSYRIDPATGLSTEEIVDGPLVLKDQPTFAPLDASDFMYDPSSSSLDTCPWVIARYWVDYDQVYEMRRHTNEHGDQVGVYQNVEKLSETRNGAGTGVQTRMPEDDTIKRDLSQKIELCELWTRDHLIVVGNRSVLMRNQQHPYGHRGIPFVTFASNPDLYSIQGISEMEVIRDLQTAIWLFLNQRIDNTKLLNNAIILSMNPEADPDMYVFAPGAIWQVDTPNEVDLWTPDHNIVEVSMQAEEGLKSDMMSITSAIPTIAGAWDGTNDPNTATQANIQMSMATKRLQAKRGLHRQALRRAELQAVSLNQQLMSAPIEYRVEKGDGSYDFETLSPAEIALGEFDIDVLDGDESFLRMQERSEANEMLAGIEPLLPILPQLGISANLIPILQKWASSYGIPDGQDIFEQLPPPVQQLLPPPGAGTGGAGQPPLAGQPAPGSGQPLLPPGTAGPEPQHVVVANGQRMPFPQ